jgi:hypothetical protein
MHKAGLPGFSSGYVSCARRLQLRGQLPNWRNTPHDIPYCFRGIPGTEHADLLPEHVWRGQQLFRSQDTPIFAQAFFVEQKRHSNNEKRV